MIWNDQYEIGFTLYAKRYGEPMKTITFNTNATNHSPFVQLAQDSVELKVILARKEQNL